MKTKFFILTLVILSISQKNYSQYALQWNARYNSPENRREEVTTMTLDDLGNVIVAGTSARKYLTVKYNASGIQQWTSLYIGYVFGIDQPYAVTADHSGNVYVTGEAGESTLNKNYTTIKYNPDGTQDWVRFYDNPEGLRDVATCILSDKSGNIYVSGYNSYGDSSCNFKWTTIKYNPNGNEIWTRQYCGICDYVLADYAPPPAMAMDSSGNIILTGTSRPNFMSDFQLVTIKYDPNGNQLWIRKLSYSYKYPSIATDKSSNIYVTGDFGIIKYNSDGDSIWVRSTNTAQSIAADDSGNVIVSGSEYISGMNKLITEKYNSSGDQMWSAESNPGYYLASMCVDKKGNTFLAGAGQNINYYDYYIIEYDKNGNQIWSTLYNDPADSGSIPSKILTDNSDNVYITGESFGIGTGYDFLTLKYSLITKTSNFASSIPDKFFLEQNYPNPFNPSTHLEFGISDLGFVSLRVFDALGKEVAVLVNEDLSPGIYEAVFDGNNYPSGIYYYKLEAGSFSEVRKMILLK